MRVLNLDSAFNPYPELQQIEYQAFSFAGGEPHIKIDPETVTDKVMVTHRLNSFNDFGLC